MQLLGKGSGIRYVNKMVFNAPLSADWRLSASIILGWAPLHIQKSSRTAGLGGDTKRDAGSWLTRASASSKVCWNVFSS